MSVAQKTFYDEVIKFGERNRKNHGRLLEPQRKQWQEEALSAALKAQGHFKLSLENLVALTRSVSVENTPTELQRLKPYLRFPFPVCWVEVLLPEGNMGLVIEQNQNPWSIKLYTFQQNGPAKLLFNPNLVKGPFAVGVQTTLSNKTLEDGTFLVTRGEWTSAESEQRSINHLFAMCKLVLLMNCRRSPFQFTNEESRKFFAATPEIELNEYKLANNNRKKAYPTHEIIFDLSRHIQSRIGNNNLPGNRIVLDDVLVRGHFKLRKTGLYFWSPYNRNIYGEATDTTAETNAPEMTTFNNYNITKRTPNADLVLPDQPNVVISTQKVSGFKL